MPDPERLVHGLPPVGVDAEPAAGVHQGRLRRPRPGARVEPGVRRQQPRGPALRAARRRDRPGPAVHAGLRHRHRGRAAACTRSTSTPATRRCSSATRRRSPARTRLTGDWYDCSAHMLWIGERTRQLDGAHVEFLRGVGNPIGCKIGPTATADDVARRCASALNPDAHPRPAHADHPHGRRPASTTRCRRCCAAVARRRPPGGVGVRPDARQHVHRRERPQDPRTSTTSSPRSPASSRAHRAEGTWPGGVHVELTGDDVTECLGGADEILDDRARRPLRDDVRPPPQRPPVASTWRSGSPSCSGAEPADLAAGMRRPDSTRNSQSVESLTAGSGCCSTDGILGSAAIR